TVNSLQSTGSITGDATFALAAPTTGDLNNFLIAQSGAGLNTATYSIDETNLPNSGLLDYIVVNDGTEARGFSIAAASISTVAATVGLTQSLVDTIVNRPTSPFVSDLAGGVGDKPCGQGVWTRVTGGVADADGGFTDIDSGLQGSSPLSMNYYGLQFGSDFACFGGHYNGWDLAFGGIGGINKANTESQAFGLTGTGNAVLENIVETDIMQRYAGVYMTAARGRFFADLQFRYEDTDYDTQNFQVDASGLSNFTTEYGNTGQTLSGALGYSWQVGPNPGTSFIASGGFSFSNNETDDVVLGTEGTLSFEDGKSETGFISATLASTRVRPDEISLISYFGTATLYNDFADERVATLTATDGVTQRQIALENLGAYGELSAGVNYVRLLSPGDAGNARQLNASVRLDARFGDDVESYGLTGQVRLQW
ncbi:MAG: hypothetical protein AB3N22_23110, partial [Ruegeria sp.]